ncbi:hypothetical protein V8C43DRAFT_24913 [Trichoderma afarasin]
MSGLEFILGTVLATVPLALEAYDRSGRVYEMYSVFKQYPRELRIIENKINTQRAIFRNNACNLLTAITNEPDIVQEVMKTPSAPAVVSRLAPAMAVLEQHRLGSLNESFTSCCSTAKLIHERLESLCSQFEAFHREVGDKDDGKSALEWVRFVGSRFKLGLHKPKINSTIEELRESNLDFGLIAEQISKALQEVRKEHEHESIRVPRSIGGLNILNKYHRIRYASNALYSSLQVRWMCSSHSSHIFDIRICDGESCGDNARAKACLPSYITCDLAITHDGSTHAPKRPLRLEVEQSCVSIDDDGAANPLLTFESDVVMKQLTAVLETNVGQMKSTDRGNSKTTKLNLRSLFKGFRQVGGQTQTGYGPTSSSTISQVPRLTNSIDGSDFETSEPKVVDGTDVPDLSNVEDICKRSQEATVNCIGRSLLGSWGNPQANLYCVPPTPQSISLSLSDIICWVAENPILRSMPRLLLFKLAGDLADGIMQFYSTPWLVYQNLGQHVRYIKLADNSQEVPYRGPYFMTRLERLTPLYPGADRPTDGYRPLDKVAPSNTAIKSVQFTKVRNQLLFALGILLLEIGYCKPWYELKQTLASTDSQMADGLSDYEAAEKLARLLINQMGLAYSKIIRKCIGCDFGLGETDLDNEDLQRRFVTDVIANLQQLEQHMKDAEI